MKAAVLEKLGSPLSVYGDLIPPLPGPGQVLVDIAYSGVCHSQLMEARGNRGEDCFLPHLLGHEGTGRVVAVGEGVTKVAPSDWVVLGWIKGTGLDASSVCYSQHGRKVNAGGVTTFNDQAVVSENRLVKLPPGVPLDIGVLFGCAVPTGAGIVTNTVKPHAGSTIVVFGLGGIGMSALMALQLFSCAKIIVVDVSVEKLALAKDFGAHVAIDAANSDVLSEIRELTNGQGVDYAVEAAGRVDTIEMAFNSVKRGGGLCVFASHPPHGQQISIDPFELICGKRLLGSWGGACSPDEDIPKFAELYRRGKLPLQKLLSKRYTLDQINEALGDLEARRVNRPLLLINPALAAEYDGA